jgi:hypothetical protein
MSFNFNNTLRVEHKGDRQGIGPGVRVFLIQCEEIRGEFKPVRLRFRREDEKEWTPWISYYDTTSFLSELGATEKKIPRDVWKWLKGGSRLPIQQRLEAQMSHFLEDERHAATIPRSEVLSAEPEEGEEEREGVAATPPRKSDRRLVRSIALSLALDKAITEQESAPSEVDFAALRGLAPKAQRVGAEAILKKLLGDIGHVPFHLLRDLIERFEYPYASIRRKLQIYTPMPERQR